MRHYLIFFSIVSLLFANTTNAQDIWGPTTTLQPVEDGNTSTTNPWAGANANTTTPTGPNNNTTFFVPTPTPGGGGGGSDNNVPIDGGLTILLAVGIGKGLKSYRSKKQKQQTANLTK